MAAKAADGGGATDLIDIYDEKFSQNNGEDGDFPTTAEASDLYDDVLTGSVSRERKFSENAMPLSKDQPTKEESKPAILYTYSGVWNKRLAVYVGNFSWWTSDKDLINVARTLGVKDIVEIKFAENRANGQSRGYAEVVVATEESLQRLLETLPNCHVNGEKVDCRFATRQNLAVFEAQANKRVPQRSNSKESSDTGDKNTSVSPPVLNQNHSTVPHTIHPQHIHNKPPPLSVPYFRLPPPLFPHLPPHIPPPPMPHLFPPPPLRLPSHPPPSLHLNPAFFPPAQHDNYSQQHNTPYNRHSSRDSEAPTPQMPEGEFDELMNRNRAIASSAITKAVSGATAGDMPLAIETLLTAIAVIKQSRVYGDERCRALVTSLKDCLFSIESKSYGSRKRHRSRDREHRSRDRERDRERERDRGREREESYSQEWEAAGMSRRHRERSLSGERDGRDRERVRERDRHREHRERHR
ncbi:cleavage and polyadenylation specificity factor subunit 7-like isoform X1 [Oncorhynchus masou masou]|uniref:cleavage and polyadenylation specificity factor subunit 7-like isoform X1 n=1 Tax=Oncorhynchus masou masou TaxID=90313 RepID=UPI003183ECF0